MESIQDIHICGGCALKFTDIKKFFAHKKQCYPSNPSQFNSQSAPQKSVTQFLEDYSTNISHHVGVESELQQADDSVNIPVSGISATSESSLSTMLGSMLTNLSSSFHPVHGNLTDNMNHTNLLTWQIKGELKKDQISKGHSSLVSNIMVQTNNPELNFSCLSPQKSSENISFDDIAVYVVSPKSFHAKRSFQELSHEKAVCSLEPTFDKGNCLKSSALPLHSSELTDASQSMTVSMIQSQANLKLQHRVQGTKAHKEFGRHSKYFLDSDINTVSQGSTPCPEDLEVGQISAAMLRDRIPQCSQRAPLDTCGSGKSDQSTSSINTFQDECSGVPEYIRDQTASAPIMKDALYSTRRISVEKRERLQGVSDDLLSSPYQDTAKNTNRLYNRDISNQATTETQGFGQVAAPASNLMSQLTGYKAVFTSPSRAGGRLKPTEIDQLKYDLKTQNNLRADRMSTAVVYSNISANPGQISSDSLKEPLADMRKLKVKKVDRKILFDQGRNVQSASDICIDGESEEANSSQGNGLHSVSYQQVSASTIDDGLVMSGPADNSSLAMKTPVQYDWTELHQIGGTLPDNKQNVFHDAKSKNCNNIPLIDSDGSIQTSLSSSNASGRGLVNMVPTSSSTMDDDVMIMVYDATDGNYVLVPKKILSGSADLASFQTFHSGSISNTSSSVVSVSHNLQQQSLDSDFYINVIPSCSSEYSGPQLLIHKIGLADTKLQQWITISTGNPATEGGGSMVLSTDQDSCLSQVSVASEVSTRKQEVTKADLTQQGNVEREKCIRKPKKNKPSPQSKTYSTQMTKSVPLKKGRSTINTCEVNLKDKVEEGQDSRKNKTFLCKFDNCRYTTTLFKDFQRHYRIHTGERPFKCKECDKRFSRSDKLNIHLKWHAGVRLFKCNICDYAALEGGSLKKHMRIHNDERPYKCQICSYASRNSSQLIVHLRTHTGDTPFHCTQCSAKFKINSDLKRHMRTHTGEKPFQCELCPYKSTNKGNLKTHIRINHSKENEIPCPTCPFVTSSKKRLREHSKVHNAKQLVSCDQCDYTCANLNALRSHASTHNANKPYRCSRCPFTCKQSGNLKKHIQNLHLEKVRLSKHARSAGSVSANRRSLHLRNVGRVENRRHRVTSSSYKKAYFCNDCGSSFVREDSLRCHMKQHNNTENTEGVLKQFSLSPRQDSKIETGATKDSSVYGCQGIQHIVAAASKLNEENISVENSQAGVNSDGAVVDRCSSSRGQKKRSAHHGGQHGASESQEGLSPSCAARKTHLPWEHRSYTLNADYKTGRSGKKYFFSTADQAGLSREEEGAQPTSKRKKSEALPVSVSKLIHARDGAHQMNALPELMQAEACFTSGNPMMTISGAAGMEKIVVTQKDESNATMEPTYSIQLVPQPSPSQHIPTDMSIYAQELIGQLTSRDLQQLQYQSGATKFQTVLQPGATILGSSIISQPGIQEGSSSCRQ